MPVLDGHDRVLQTLNCLRDVSGRCPPVLQWGGLASDAFSGEAIIHFMASSTSASEAVGVNSVCKARWASG
jgi:hypothetical protein